MPKTEKHSHDIGCVIFDVDGTLVDNLELIVRSFNYAVEDLVSRSFSQKEVYARFGPTLEQMIEEIVSERNVDDAVQRYHAHYRKHFHQYARVYPGIPSLISGLRNICMNVGIYTGSDARMTKTTLDESGLRAAFSVIVTADDVREPKPDPEGLIKAMFMLQAKPEHTLYLGDAVRDVEASKRAGAISAAALWGFGDEKKLRAVHPNYAFSDAAEVLDQLSDRPR